MLRPTMDTSVLRDPSWWHWAATIPLLACHLAGHAWAIDLAVVLCAVMAGYYYARLRTVRPLPVQLRLAYLALLLVGMIPSMGWLHWVQLVGTTAMVICGYCLLGRLLSLLALNRAESLTWFFARQKLFGGPCVGGFVQWSPVGPEVAACCSVPWRAAPPFSSPAKYSPTD